MRADKVEIEAFSYSGQPDCSVWLQLLGVNSKKGTRVKDDANENDKVHTWKKKEG